MALNVKAAMLLCMGFIGAISWVARQVEAPQIEMTSPLAVGAARVDFTRALGSMATLTNGEADRRAGWARQFERPNAIDTQAEANHAAGTLLAVWSPTEPIAERLPSAVLPPLVTTEADVALASAEETLPVGAAAPAPLEVAAVPESADDAPAGVERLQPRSYRVARGDTLTRIARRHWNSEDTRLVKLLVEANPQLSDRKNGQITVGEEIRVPDADVAARILAGDQAPVDVAAAAPKTGTEHWYTIRRNDTLADIAQRFLNDSRRWREIAELNGKLNPHKIVPGTRIKLPPVMRLARG